MLKYKIHKKGQITIFIIVAIIIIAAISLYFIFRETLEEDIITPETEGIYQFVRTCIENVGEDAVFYIGQNGGYFLYSEFSTDTGIPYYYVDGENHMPSKSRIEREISHYVNEMLFFCTRNFGGFPDFNITQREIKTKTQIGESKVLLNIEYPLRITKGDSTSVLRNFENIEVPVRLGVVYSATREMIEDQLGREGICLSCMLDIVIESDLYVDMIDYDEETVVFIVKDKNSKIDDVAFEFIFANKYRRGE